MFTHIAKGSTVGHVLTRRLLRGILGIPGLIADLVVALAWRPDYSQYWQDAACPYFDGETVGPCQWFTGGLGELLGYAIGSPLGALIGIACFIPDMILSGACWLYSDFICPHLNNLAIAVGERDFFRRNFGCMDVGDSYSKKAWNIASIVLGFPLAVLPWGAGKAIEFFLPFTGNVPSNFLGGLAGLTGSCVGWCIGIAIAPVNWMADKLVTKYHEFRDAVRSVCAFIYAKGHEDPAHAGPDYPFSRDEQVHSAEFRDKTRRYAATSTFDILFGPSLRVPPAAVQQAQQQAQGAVAAVVPVPVAARPVPNAPPAPADVVVVAPGGPAR